MPSARKGTDAISKGRGPNPVSPGSDMRGMSPAEIRGMIRRRRWKGHTTGLASGYAQANLVTLPGQYAFDFLLFCQRNPKPCPVLEVITDGGHETVRLARRADIRSDIPRYMVYRDGKLDDSPFDVRILWRDDFVSFLLGCSFSFEEAMIRACIPVRNVEEKKNVPMYITSIPCAPAGVFSGPLVVTMRPIPPHQVVKAVQVTSRHSQVHGAPVHIGDPATIGIKDLGRPDFGEPVTVRAGEIPVFWACGVTPQEALLSAKPEICITHAPGHMFITDILNEELATV